MVTSKDAAGNIFLTMENLAFAMPLILLCGGYAYFKYIPLQYGLPILGCVAGLLFFRSKMEARRAEKLQNLDEGMIEELAGTDDSDDGENIVKTKKQNKAKAQVERRLAAEKKKAAKNNGKKGTKDNGDDDDDDDADILTFAKGSREKQKKR